MELKHKQQNIPAYQYTISRCRDVGKKWGIFFKPMMMLHHMIQMISIFQFKKQYIYIFWLNDKLCAMTTKCKSFRWSNIWINEMALIINKPFCDILWFFYILWYEVWYRFITSYILYHLLILNLFINITCLLSTLLFMLFT